MAVTRTANARLKQQQGVPLDATVGSKQSALQWSHWREMVDPATGRLMACRVAGSPAGSFPHTPWWHCVFHDPYERINFWSHAVPGAGLALLGLLSAAGLCRAGASLALYCCCAAATHLCSALTHVYPDSHSLEKADHVGIVATIVGTPITALMAQQHGHIPTPMLLVALSLLGAAFLPPTPRVAGFVGGGAVAVLLYWRQLASWTIATELALYLLGAAFFLRNGGHDRWIGLTDHHFLHYFVTAAAVLHVCYILSADPA